KLRPELGIPEAVEAVVMHAMAKDRSRRYARMSDVERDLERLLAGDQNVGPEAGVVLIAPAPVGPSRSRPWVWGAAIAALVGGVVMVLARPEAAPESSRAAAALPAARAPGESNVPTPGPEGTPAPVAPAPAPAGGEGLPVVARPAPPDAPAQKGGAIKAAEPSTARRPVRAPARLARDRSSGATRPP